MNFLIKSIIIASLVQAIKPQELDVPLPQNEIVVMPPQKEGKEAVLIINPGGALDGEDYREIGEVIQKQSNLKLWVVLIPGAPPTGQLPHFIKILKNMINASFQKLSDMGFGGDTSVFLCGHNLGGGVGQLVAKTDDRITAVVLWGAYVISDIKDYPKPVLTLNGELDGLVRITRIVEEFQELLKLSKSNPNITFEKPVIVMPGVNHAQFSSGNSNYTMQFDLSSDVSNEAAFMAIAKNTNAFLEYTVEVHAEANKMKLRGAFKTTAKLIGPFLRAKLFDINSRNESFWTKNAQIVLAKQKVSASKKLLLKAQNTIVDESLLLETSANVEVSAENEVNMQTVTAVIQPVLGRHQYHYPQTPVELAAKFITKEAIQTLFPKFTFRTALSFASLQAKKRAYRRFREVPVSFNPDIMVSNKEQWLDKRLKIERNPSGISVTSAAFKRENSGCGKSDSRLFCKLLSLYRALEIISIDILRPNFYDGFDI